MAGFTSSVKWVRWLLERLGEQASEKNVALSPKLVTLGAPRVYSPSGNEGRRDHSRIHSFAYPGLPALKLYLN